MSLAHDLKNCQLCSNRFAATETAHSPRPVVWFRSTAQILVAGQAPGMRVHQSGRPFDDPSGDRLRDWMGVSRAVFYDQTKIAIVPMAFCFPGYNAKGSDLPPPLICRRTWHDRIMQTLPHIRLRLIIGGYAQKYHLGTANGVTETVQNWRAQPDGTFPLPHPSWRNTGWLKKHPWFEAELLPELKAAVQEVLK